ncbi:MAG: hypothetical protein IT521_06380 [Burkholderiales bacterium]|nr:hypothetical protein [Burkholderiales bacterium]
MSFPLFLAIVAAMTVLVAAWVLRPLLARRASATRARRVDNGTPAGRGERRIRRGRGTGIAASIALPLLAGGLYLLLGEPAAISDGNELDAQAAFDALPATAMREELTAHLVRNKRDARGWIMLARLEFEQDRYAEAAEAYRRAIDANRKVDADPAIWCEYADALGMAQGGSLVGRPREFVQQALARNPDFPKALEMAGSAAFEAREYTVAAKYWRTLADAMPEEAPARRELSAAATRADLLAQSSGAPATSRGALLYDTHCIACHDKQVHWRDGKLAKDWTSLEAQVRRWQANVGLRWPDATIDEVVRYLNTTIYRYPDQARIQKG